MLRGRVNKEREARQSEFDQNSRGHGAAAGPLPGVSLRLITQGWDKSWDKTSGGGLVQPWQWAHEHHSPAHYPSV